MVKELDKTEFVEALGQPVTMVFVTLFWADNRSRRALSRLLAQSKWAFAILIGALGLGVAGCDGSTAAGSSSSEPSRNAAPTVTVTSKTYPTLGSPYQALPLSNGDVLVSVTADGTTGAETGVQVFKPSGGGLTLSCVDQLSPGLVVEDASMANLDLAPNGVSAGGGIGSPGAMFWNLTSLENCSASGTVLSQGSISANEGTIEAVVTPDGKYAFVVNQSGLASGSNFVGNVGVVQLQTDTNGNVTGGTLLGQIPTNGAAINGIAMSPDGTRIYLTTGVAGLGSGASGSNNPVLAETNCFNATGGPNRNGLLTVINVAAAEASQGTGAILAKIDAGCTPVGVVESSSASVLWVAARGDNRVLAFSPSTLESNPDNALLGYADQAEQTRMGSCCLTTINS